MKLILQAIKALFRKVENAIEDVRKSIPEVAQANWLQNDRTKPDYVKNRTHYEEVKQESIEGVELSWNIGQDHDTIPFELGQTWDFYLYNSSSGNWINWNYSGANDEGHYPVQQATDGTFYIGDPNVNDIPFYITTTSSALNGSFENMNKATKLKIVGVSGTKTVTKVKTLDEKYVPDGAKPFKVTLSSMGNSSDRTYSEIKAAHDAGRFVYAETGNGQRYPFRSFGMYNSKNAAFFTINSVTVGNPNFITVWDVAVTDEGCTRTLQMLNALKNPNAITFTGAVEATYDGSEAVSVEIPSDDHINELIDTALGEVDAVLDEINGEVV